MKPILAAIAASLITLSIPASAQSPDASGTWLTENGKARVRIAKCGSALCGNIAWLAEPTDASGQPKKDVNNSDVSKRTRALLGVPILQSMQPDSGNRWKGSIYNAEDGKTYTAYLTLEGDTRAKVEGCALGGMICKAQTWTKVR